MADTPILTPPMFMWGQGGMSSPMMPTPVVLVGVDAEGSPYIVNSGGSGGTGTEGPPGPQGEPGPPGPQGPPGEVPIKGVTDGSEAAPGDVGEYKVVANTTGVELEQNLPKTVCTLHLEPGDWEIWGSVDFTPPGNVSPNMICSSVSVNPDALPTNDDLMTGVGILNMFTTAAMTSGERQVLMTGQCRSNSANPIDLYLVAQCAFGGATNRVNAKGYICSRRAR